jgi:hypothetical protein
MNPLTPDQLKRLRDHVILSGVLDDDLEDRVVREMAGDVEVKINYGHLSFEEAFEKVKKYAVYQQLGELQEHRRELLRTRRLLKRDTLLAVLLLPLLSAVLFAFNRGEAFVGFWEDLTEGLGLAALFCVPFAVWRIWQVRKTLRELEDLTV